MHALGPPHLGSSPASHASGPAPARLPQRASPASLLQVGATRVLGGRAQRRAQRHVNLGGPCGPAPPTPVAHLAPLVPFRSFHRGWRRMLLLPWVAWRGAGGSCGHGSGCKLLPGRASSSAIVHWLTGCCGATWSVLAAPHASVWGVSACAHHAEQTFQTRKSLLKVCMQAATAGRQRSAACLCILS